MTIGGFSGSDPAITLTQFKKLVKEGKVKYFLASGRGRGGNNDIVEWVEKTEKKCHQINGNQALINNHHLIRKQKILIQLTHQATASLQAKTAKWAADLAE